LIACDLIKVKASSVGDQDEPRAEPVSTMASERPHDRPDLLDDPGSSGSDLT
jgi:hypothetical protein